MHLSANWGNIFEKRGEFNKKFDIVINSNVSGITYK